MYKKYRDKVRPGEERAGRGARRRRAGVPGAQITVLSVVDWHDFNAETFKIASRMSGVMGELRHGRASGERGADMDAIADNIAPLCGRRRGHWHRRGERSPHGTPTRAATTASLWATAALAPCGMLGSVCYSVLHKTNVPVLIVK